MGLLQARHLSIGYRNKDSEDITLAKNLSYDLHRGKLVSVVGVNGIGKSTLIKTLSGLIPPLKGEITLSEQPLDEQENEKRAKLLSLVLTRKNSVPNLLVSELLALGRQPYLPWWGKLSKEDRDQIEEVVQLLSLEKLQKKNCNELSDGQLQKVYLGRALVQDTPVILLDEPTTHLDMEHRAEILLLLKELVLKKQKAILFSTHDLEWALQVCHSIWLINGKDNPDCSPQEFIDSGLYSSLFSDDFIAYDPKDKRFKLQQNRYL